MVSECRSCGKPRSGTSPTCGHCGARVSLDDLGPKKAKSAPVEPVVQTRGEHRASKSVEHWKFLLAAVLLLAVGIWLFYEFSQLEAGEIDVMHTHALFAMLYRAIGKWGVLALCGTPAAIVVFAYAKALLTPSR